MIRQHQFDKVELVHIVRPEDSYAALEELTGHAEAVLQALELPYACWRSAPAIPAQQCQNLRSRGMAAFAAAATRDFICSNCESFQARRLQARWRNPVHQQTGVGTHMNGSGVAVGRALVAVLGKLSAGGRQHRGSDRARAVHAGATLLPVSIALR